MKTSIKMKRDRDSNQQQQQQLKQFLDIWPSAADKNCKIGNSITRGTFAWIMPWLVSLGALLLWP